MVEWTVLSDLSLLLFPLVHNELNLFQDKSFFACMIIGLSVLIATHKYFSLYFLLILLREQLGGQLVAN